MNRIAWPISSRSTATNSPARTDDPGNSAALRIVCKNTTGRPPEERYSDSVPGPFYVVKDRCLICGLPPQVAPLNIAWSHETFLFNNRTVCPTHCRIERQPETAEELGAMIEAACGSCVEAIRYGGSDPGILAAFKERGYGLSLIHI